MIEVKGIKKRFGQRHALRGVSFDVARGRVTGFVGANGAGKTTTMRIILGIMSLDAGEVTMDGRVASAIDRLRFGYMPEERGLYAKMRVAEHIAYLGSLRGMATAHARRSTALLIEQLDLQPYANATIDTLSLGNQQRVQLAGALVHSPDVLILDEPFSGLDPFVSESIRAVLEDRAAGGAAILVSSHQLDLIDRICDDVVVLVNGEVRIAGDAAELARTVRGTEWALRFDGSTQWLHDSRAITVLDERRGVVRFVADPDDARQILEAAVEMGEVISFGPARSGLSYLLDASA